MNFYYHDVESKQNPSITSGSLHVSLVSVDTSHCIFSTHNMYDIGSAVVCNAVASTESAVPSWHV